MVQARGFSFIEILVALVIIGFVGTFGMSLLRRNRSAAIESLVDTVNRFTRLAYLRALTTGKLHRVYFSMVGDERIQVEEEAGIDSKGNRTFQQLPALFVPTKHEWDPRFVIDHCLISGTDEVGVRGVKDLWFYVFPSGTAQDVVLDLRDEAEDVRRRMVLNPFSVRFTVYDGYEGT